MQEKRKKNWVLRVACLALVFTLISTCLLGGTLAKYTTTNQGSDKARVAKWGVQVGFDANSAGCFQTEYETVTIDTFDNNGDPIELSVESSTAENVIAPGTDGSFTFSITGTPEVAVEIYFSATGSLTGTWEAPTSETDPTLTSYTPVTWTLEKDGDPIDYATETGTSGLAGLIEYLNDYAEIAGKYEPNTDLSDLFGTYTIGWEWFFSSTGNANDYKDTYLGNIAAGIETGTTPGIDLAFNISVTQID